MFSKCLLILILLKNESKGHKGGILDCCGFRPGSGLMKSAESLLLISSSKRVALKSELSFLANPTFTEQHHSFPPELISDAL